MIFGTTSSFISTLFFSIAMSLSLSLSGVCFLYFMKIFIGHKNERNVMNVRRGKKNERKFVTEGISTRASYFSSVVRNGKLYEFVLRRDP